MPRARLLPLSLLLLGALTACLGIDPAPSRNEGVPPAGGPSGPGAAGTDGGGASQGETEKQRGATGTVGRRFARWPLPPPSPLLSNYDLSPDVVVDKTTSLAWTRKAATPEYANYTDGHAYCERLVLGGNDDWRLPSRI